MTLQERIDQAEIDCQMITDMLHTITDDELRYVAAYYFMVRKLGRWTLTDVMHQRMVLSELDCQKINYRRELI